MMGLVLSKFNECCWNAFKELKKSMFGILGSAYQRKRQLGNVARGLDDVCQQLSPQP